MWHGCPGGLAEALEATNSRRGWDFLMYFIVLQVVVLEVFFPNIWKCRLEGGDKVQEVRPGSRLLVTVDKTEFCRCEITVFSKFNSVGPV